MSDIFTAPGASETAIPAADLRAEDRASRSWLRWPAYAAALFFAVWLTGILITFLIHHTRLQRKLTGRLESVFGRHVDVRSYDFSLWSGPTLTAEDVTFSEDPRFGHEYFLRAESVKIRLHWQSLFRGHMDLGTISLERPSLNLVRNSAGDWNLAEWLPRPAASAAALSGSDGPARAEISEAVAPAASSGPYVRFDRILVDSGRINFKRDDEKIPFAFTDVSGSVEPDAPGRWRIDLEAVPTRAAVPLQQAGSIHLAGQVGGTSSRMRPANFAVTWTDASISDVLRLARGYDFGIRGDFSLALNARTVADDWAVETRTSARAMHRWDLTSRPDNPAVNVLAKFTVHPQADGFDVTGATIEAPHSTALAAAHFSWTSQLVDSGTGVASPRAEIRITESSVSLVDALAWIRAFHPGVAADATLTGYAGGTAVVQSAPLRVASADANLDGVELSAARLLVPARLGPAEFRYEGEAVNLTPTILSFGKSGSALHLEASTKSSAHEFPVYRVSGSLEQVRDVIAAAGALGWNISRGWDVGGPVRCDLRWQTTDWPWQSQPAGTIDWGLDAGAVRDSRATDGAPESANDSATDSTTARDATLRAPYLNEPVRQIRAHLDLKPGSRHVSIASADAFGGHWSGTVEAREPESGWQFALAADRLSVADADRWLNPRWRQSFLDRMLPFLNSNSSPASEPDNLRASGHISIDQFTAAPLSARRVQGNLKLTGRSLELTSATAQLAGGNVAGKFSGRFDAVPEYRVSFEFAGLDVAELTADSPSLAGQFKGSATGAVALVSRGASRSELGSALECEGTARIASAELQNINLEQSFRQNEIRTGTESFRDGAAHFTCSDGAIHFRRLTLINPGERLDATGSISFSRTLELRFTNAAGPNVSYEISGPLANPSLKSVQTEK